MTKNNSIKDEQRWRPSMISDRYKYNETTTYTPWEIIIPSSLFAASAVCWIDPTIAPSIIFALLAFATINITPVMQYFTKPATEGLTITITDALNTITSEKHSEQREKLFFAIADLISKSVQSTALRTTLKESLLSSLMDDDLHDATLNTLQTALIKASENEGFRSTALHVVKEALVGALRDEDFVRDLMSSIVGAMVQASQEEELTQSVLDVVTRAVSQALADESFVSEIRGAVKDTLQDGDLYKAGAKGMISAAGFGLWGKGNSSVEDERKSSTTKSSIDKSGGSTVSKTA